MPIKSVDILVYCREREFDEDQTDRALYLIRQMDNAFIKWLNEKQEKKKPQKRHGHQQKFRTTSGPPPNTGFAIGT